MDVPISKIDIEYLIDAAEKAREEGLPEYISYILFKEAEKRLLPFVAYENTACLNARIANGLRDFQEDQECPKKYEKMSLIEILVDIYLEYDYKNKIDSSETSERFLTTSEVLLTALKMLCLANMDVPISKIDIEYLIDAAEKIFCVEGIAEYISYKFFGTKDLESRIYKATCGIFETSETDAAARTYTENQRYISYRLFQEARETLAQFMNYQSLLIGPAENTEELESRIDKGLKRLTDEEDINIPECPEDYRDKSTIQVLVKFYRKYNEDNRIDEIRQEDEKHKKWSILSEDYQELEVRSAMRERILTTSKALRTALKMLSRVIPNEFLQDTEYDGSNETYNIIPFDGLTDRLPAEVKRAIASLKWGIEDFPPRTRGHDVLDCLQKCFGFQESSVSNQRENIVNLLSNEQMRPFTPGEHGTALEAALEKVFSRTLDNYTKWCRHLSKKPIWKNTDENATGEDEDATGEDEDATGEDGNATAMDGNATAMYGNATVKDGNATAMDENATAKDKNVISKDKKILYISLYYLIWGEAANVRFLPECLCYIFHCMGEQLDDKDAIRSVSFIEDIIHPLYKAIETEAVNKKDNDVPHSKWRNYDDFNEHFWSPLCKEQKQKQEQEQLGWPINVSKLMGKPSFIERRTFWHLYHSFHRMWILHVMMFQALVIFAFNDGKLNSKTLREILSVGPTYFLMKLIQSMLDIGLKYGAYSKTSRVDVLQFCFRFIWFMLASYYICFLYMKCLQEMTSSIEESIGFKIYITVLGIYAVFKISFSISSQFLSKKYKNFLLDLYLEEEYVGCGMAKELAVYITYMIFWLVTLAINTAYTYHYLISPLVRPTRDITDVSKNIHNMLAIGSLWAGVICAYIVGSHISYNVISAFVGTFVGHTERLGNIKFLGDFHKCFDKIPTAFMDHSRESPLENNQEDVKKLDAAEFSPFWNQIVMHLREEDYISDKEQDALNMPEKSGCIDVVQWPLFLLVGKVSLAIKIAEKKISPKDMWDEISRDAYMKYAVEECFHSVKFILCSVLDNEGKEWVEDIKSSNLCSEFQLKELDSFVKAITKLITKLDHNEYANKELKKVIQHDFLGENEFAGEQISISDSDWRTDLELRSQIERLHLLLTMDKSAADGVPRNPEARRRLEFFTNSLFMSMPTAKPVREMLSFSVLTPYYEETVIYSLDELQSHKGGGVTLIDYLKNLYPDEWTNHCERMKKRDTHDGQVLELRLWASYRGQTLARTVRGTMYYQKALLLQAYREMLITEGSGEDGLPSTSPVPDVSMDEDTQATLNTLEERSSSGELLVQTSGTMLCDKENYNPWREQMMAMLESEINMTGFVDGSLRDPDPKGESQDEYVFNYSQKWKKLDKIVKDWIMASLNDILKNMVKEMKTAKELWETLEMFFSTDIISSVNVTDHVSINLLNKDQYRDWVSQMENFLQAKRMFCFIIGKFEDPDPKEESQDELVRIYSKQWKELDKQVMEWIKASLSESMYDSVKDSETAEQMWDALKEIIRSQCLDYAKAHVDLKFTCVVSCQIYGKQKIEEQKFRHSNEKRKDKKLVAADIAFLLKRNEGLRVAYIDENEEKKEFYSKLVKADKNGKETEIYSIKLPGNPKLGEGKPENQNHAIVFTRGNAIQTIDMNQDNYFEETLKMRNLLEEFHRKDDAVKDDAVKDDVIHPPTILGKPSKITKDDVIHPPTILGIREHIFTGSASSLASFMSNQETGFVTLGQRVIANPLKVRMHYGHPDVFDRVFHITRGGISKASRGINISEDIYAGFNSTLRQGSVTHHEYIQAGKGRDVGFNQIATFEGKVAGGNGEQVLSRDIYRLGLRLDFFRMLSFYYTTVGYYFSSLLMVITLYIILYGNLIMALSGTRVPHVLNDIDMAPEWFLMIVLLPAIYMLLVPYLEQGLEKAVESFLAMFFSLGSIFFAFSLGTRIHWFGRTIIHGGASYQATGRGFVLHHITFSENYRLYSRSHFVKGMEVLFLVVVYIIYGFHSVRAFYNNLLLLGGSILSISWIVAPFLFDSSPFDLNKNSEDQEDWKNWLNRKSDEVEKSKRIEEKVKESWEIWWTRELDHIRTPAGRIIETILSLRFFIFPLVVGYKLDVQGLKNSLSNCVIPWIFLVGILFAHEFFSNKKPEIYFFSYNQLATIGALAIAYYYSAFGDMLAFFIAIITTVWGFLSICVACKPTLKRFSLWTTVKYLARICDTGMGALMFRIANMFSQRSIKQYLVRNMFDQNISELLHNSSTELKMQSTTWVGDPTTRNATSSSISKPPFYRSRDEYINMLPAMYHNFIVDVRDVDRDGNSGFRAVAVGLGRHQNEWKNIRSDLLQELEKHKKGYRKMFPGQYDIVKNRLTFFKDDEFAPEEKWMEMPAIGVLIATHFKVILHIITNSGSQTYLPLYSCPPSWNRLKFISLGHVDKHYVHLLLKKGYPMPHLMEFYRKSKWKRMYLKWIKEGNIS